MKDIINLISKSKEPKDVNYFSSPRTKAMYGEMAIWYMISIAISGNTLISLSKEKSFNNRIEIIQDNYSYVILSLVLLIFPFIFNSIFDALPLELLRIRRMTVEQRAAYRGRGSIRVLSNSPQISLHPPETLNNLAPPHTAQSADPSLVALHLQVEHSKALASKIFNRAGVYLLVGALTAFSGLAFFYIQAPTQSVNPDISSIIVNLAPKFGILFFIEFIAFFFLRQYRGAMDEFRYYESLQRSREEMIFSYNALKGLDDDLAFSEAIKSSLFSSKVLSLSPGHTTENIEIRKLESNELAGLAKIIEGLSSFKK
ncbi:hypothetical protein [Sphingomonas yabuuchiae]|uniref:hypothetical protein n=1 Tax=Sphingomonas yabuuchiae TaxID=172044 RepID=UPI003D99C54A